MISILSPCYNRAYILPKAYESLLRQSSRNFQWIIIDDGSTDGTRELVGKWIAEDRFPIEYHYKENGGKHTALNLGFSVAKGELILILDSDDHLAEDAVATIEHEWNALEASERTEIAGIDFLRGYASSGEPIGSKFPSDHYRADTIRLRTRDRVKGDKCEVYRTDILKKNPFPVFENERFLTEEVLWNRIAKMYEMIHINKIIYYGEYLEDGLTVGRKSKHPTVDIKGSILNHHEKTSKHFPFRTRVGSMKKYISLSLWNTKLLQIVRKADHPILCVFVFPLGIVHHMKERFKARSLGSVANLPSMKE